MQQLNELVATENKADLTTANDLKKEFYQLFGREDEYPVQLFFAPGRVCLMGEHVDYNGGLVMPAAISRGIHAVYRREDNDVIWMRSTIDNRDVVFPLNHDIEYDQHHGWGNYPLGVIRYLRQQGIKIGGGEILFHSNLPVGVGLSSSAAVEIITAFLFSQLDPDSRLDLVALSNISKRAENEFVGVKCGVMDQVAVALGKKDHTMLLNCTTMHHEFLPLRSDEYSVVIMNTNKSRELATSNFNVRVAECAAGLAILQQHEKLETLADADPEWVKRYIHDPLLFKRAWHIANENRRVKHAAEALQVNDLKAFGLLMTESHNSLRDNYEVSGFELDTMVDLAIAQPGCLGAKLTGAGFGGCCVGLVKNEDIEEFTETVLTGYHQRTNRKGDIFTVTITDGVRRVE